MHVEDYAISMKGQYEALPPLKYLTDAEVDGAAEEDAPTEVLRDHNCKLQATSMDFIRQAKPLPKHNELRCQNLQSLTESQYRKVVADSLGKTFASTSACDDVFDDDEDDCFDEREFRKNAATNTTRSSVEMPQLTRDQQKEIFEFLASQCHIIHDAFVEIPQISADDIEGEHGDKMRLAVDAATGNLNPVPLDNTGKVKTRVSRSEEANFWEFQRSQNVVSSNPMPADAALQYMFNVDYERLQEDSWGNIRPEVTKEARQIDPSLGECSPLFPTPWQVIGAAWLRQMEQTPIHGGILSDGCGTGKTNTILLHIAWAAERLEARMASGKYTDSQKANMDCRPTLVLVPNNCVCTWIEEMRKYFDGVLDCLVMYGRPEDLVDPWTRQHTLPSDPIKCVQYLRNRYEFNHISGARTVVICAYQTFTMRFVGTMHEHEKTQQDRLFGDLYDDSKCKLPPTTPSPWTRRRWGGFFGLKNPQDLPAEKNLPWLTAGWPIRPSR